MPNEPDADRYDGLGKLLDIERLIDARIAAYEERVRCEEGRVIRAIERKLATHMACQRQELSRAWGIVGKSGPEIRR